MSKITVGAIVAMDQARGIGIKNGLPWDLPEDRKHFAAITKGHTVLMGRKTYESLPAQFRPLKNRLNVVITRDPQSLAGEQGIWVRSDPQKFIRDCISGIEKLPSEELWIIGGEQIYRATAELWNRLELTLVSGVHPSDAFFPDYAGRFEEKSREDRQGFSFISLERDLPLGD